MLFQNNYLINGFLEISDYHNEYNLKEIQIYNTFPSPESLELIDKKKINFIIYVKKSKFKEIEFPDYFKIVYQDKKIILLENKF